MTLAARALVAMVKAYRRLPRIRPAVCRFDPTCSSYAVEAIGRHGALKGTWLSLRRVGKCHPWGPMGFDPVPPAVESHDTAATSSHLVGASTAPANITRKAS